jgi:hypothetical protein
MAMRLIMTCVAFTALVAAGVAAQDAAAPAKGAVTDLAIIKIRGSHFTDMFAQFGTPQIVVATRGRTPDEDDVLFNFGAFIIRVGKDQKINNCFILKNWKGPIRGIKIGDSREDVVKVLGNASMTFKDKNGTITDYGYRMKDLGVEFYVNFDENGNVKRVQIGQLE